MTKSGSYLVTLYASLAICYWLPGLHDISFLKLTVIALACFLIVSTGELSRLGLQKALSFFFLALISILPSFFLSGIENITDYVLNVAIICAFYVASTATNPSLAVTLSNALQIIRVSVLSLVGLHIFGSVTGTFDSLMPFVDRYTRFSDIGFNLSRTGWSASLGLMTPIFFINQRTITGLIMVLPILISQIISGGRGGALASVIVVLMTLIQRRQYALLTGGLTISAVLILINAEYLTTHLRVDRISNGTHSLNDFSSGRIDTYLESIDIFLSNPIFGIGYGNMDLTAQTGVRLVHNTFMLIISELGIFCLPFFIGLFRLFKDLTDVGTSHSVKRSVPLAAAFTLMMLEPGILIRSFQNSFGFWLLFFLGVLSDD